MDGHARLMRGHGACAFVALIACAPSLAQPPAAITFEAETVALDLRGGGSSFTGLTVTDGAVTVDAAEGTRTNDNADDGIWEFRRGLRVTIAAATLTAQSGTLRFADGAITGLELLGYPVTLDAPGQADASRFMLTAGRIAYDGNRRQLLASDEVVFVSDGFEFRDCDWTYDLADRSVEGLPQTGARGCKARIAVNRTNSP